MTLWVRNQDKTILYQVKYFTVGEFTPITEIDGEKVENVEPKWGISSISDLLGLYDSKQRCIEILDEIQRLIVNSNKTILTTSSDLDQRTYDDILEEVEKNNFTVLSCVNTPQVFPLNQNIVYQMPEK